MLEVRKVLIRGVHPHDLALSCYTGFGDVATEDDGQINCHSSPAAKFLDL